jgi:hypothetical protein
VSSNLAVWAVVAAAAITGVATFFGTYVGTVKTQNAENNRIEARLRQDAKGAARLLVLDLVQANDFLEAVLRQDIEPEAVPREVGVRLSLSDLKLVESRLDPVQFNTVSAALDKLGAFLSQFRRTTRAFGRPHLRRATRRQITLVGGLVDRAVAALLPLADAENTPLAQPGRTLTPVPRSAVP